METEICQGEMLLMQDVPTRQNPFLQRTTKPAAQTDPLLPGKCEWIQTPVGQDNPGDALTTDWFCIFIRTHFISLGARPTFNINFQK